MKDINHIAAPMAWASFVRMATEVWHKLDWCSCHNLFMQYFDPCPIGIEELREMRRQEVFNQWDGVGLGYIGPKL
jgi:hypothetical protein